MTSECAPKEVVVADAVNEAQNAGAHLVAGLVQFTNDVGVRHPLVGAKGAKHVCQHGHVVVDNFQVICGPK